MIVAKDWIWLHVPKCGGTSTEKMLHALYGDDPSVAFDPVGRKLPVIWHQSIQARQKQDPSFSVNGRKVIGNIRRLPYWLLSRVHFELQRAGDAALVTRAQLRDGKFRSRPGPEGKTGKLASADDMITNFASDVTHWMRTEHLMEDMARVFPLPPDVPLKEVRENSGKIGYVKDIRFWFTRPEINNLYEKNPVWAQIERSVYGDLLSY
ncbi:hypothetical protein [Cereibacter johrii]|uniref:Sulfotransferase family protein n=1 Tax=Cereibacter johrii TaxID=445629 RepID=A0ABX5J240_9RHOB|nr:hypothetical protein [Cereibacter johrii]ODM44550.1 hypothetical protein A9O63_15880 [Cereibacter johrii]PTM75269.1 hypothetical protein C8J29_11259 [Cereibacter johrii]RAZ84264.1 hypothetical protein DDV93_12645 [Cereibacter johrii]